MELDKIKEILKESTGAPTAKMDMNLSKILMSMLDSIDSIAQQDYLRLRIENLLSPTEDEKAKIRSAIFDTHTIFDTLIETNDGDVVSRVVEVNDSNSEITIVVSGVTETIGYSED